jgi:hypothetical protein
MMGAEANLKRHRGSLHPLAGCSTSRHSQGRESTLKSINRQRDKANAVYMHREYYSATKKRAVPLLVTVGLHLDDIVLGEPSQAQKDKCCIVSQLVS